MSSFDICKDKWFFEPGNEQERTAFLEWVYGEGMKWGGVTPTFDDDVCIGGNNYEEGRLGFAAGVDAIAEGRQFYKYQGHVEIFPVFKYKMCVDNVPLPVLESPQQKRIRELEETISKAQEQIESLKKVI